MAGKLQTGGSWELRPPSGVGQVQTRAHRGHPCSRAFVPRVMWLWLLLQKARVPHVELLVNHGPGVVPPSEQGAPCPPRSRRSSWEHFPEGDRPGVREPQAGRPAGWSFSPLILTFNAHRQPLGRCWALGAGRVQEGGHSLGAPLSRAAGPSSAPAVCGARVPVLWGCREESAAQRARSLMEFQSPGPCGMLLLPARQAVVLTARSTDGTVSEAVRWQHRCSGRWKLERPGVE